MPTHGPCCCSKGKLDLLPVVAARNSLTTASTVFCKNGVFYSQRPLQRSLPNQLFVVNLKNMRNLSKGNSAMDGYPHLSDRPVGSRRDWSIDADAMRASPLPPMWA